MDDFSYSAIRSFNQFLNGSLSLGTGEQLVLNPYPGHLNLEGSDTVSVHFYGMSIEEFGGGRWAGGSKGRKANLACQIDVWSPPNSSGEARNGANRKLKDKVEQVFKDRARINLLQWDGTGGTTVAGGMHVRQTDSAWMPVEEMEGWTRWRLEYKVWGIDHEG